MVILAGRIIQFSILAYLAILLNCLKTAGNGKKSRHFFILMFYTKKLLFGLMLIITKKMQVKTALNYLKNWLARLINEHL